MAARTKCAKGTGKKDRGLWSSCYFSIFKNLLKNQSEPKVYQLPVL